MIVRGQRSITADTALRLARYFQTTERFWLNLQTRYDLEVEKDRLGTAWIARLPGSRRPIEVFRFRFGDRGDSGDYGLRAFHAGILRSGRVV